MPHLPEDPSMVIAYYANPRSGKVEKHQMTSITFEEASRPRYVEFDQVASDEESLWTLEPPEGVDENDIVDMTPRAFIAHSPQASPPPAVATHSPQILKSRASTAPAVKAPTRGRG